MIKKTLTPTHPGKILLRGIRDHELSVSQVARKTGIPVSTLSAITHGKRPISAGNALRIAQYFGTTAKYWTNLQSDYDLRMASMALADKVSEEVMPLAV